MSKAAKGDKVTIHYTGKTQDGNVFDSSQGGDPLQFTVGSGELIPGVNNAVEGMSVGESKTVEIAPQDGYGQRQDGLEQRVARNMLPAEAKEGDPLRAQAEGQEIIVWVKELGEEEAVLDANHPLAGKTLVFDLELVSVG